jgi:uncharacterized protein (TIGR02145 family)
MKNKFTKIALTATLVGAVAFTLCSCVSLRGARKITPEEYGKVQIVDSVSVEWLSWQFLYTRPNKEDIEFKAVSKLRTVATEQGYRNIEIRDIQVQGNFGWASAVFGYFPCAYMFCNVQHVTAYGYIVKTTEEQQFTIVAHERQERIAIIQTVDDGDSIKFSDLNYLTDRLRETAVNILPKSRYGVMTTESIVAFLGSQERAAKECREATCLAELGRKVNADYVAQGRIGRFGENLTIKAELYSSKSGNLLGSFTGNSKDVFGLLGIIDEKAPALFKRMLDVSDRSVEIDKFQGEKFLIDARDGKKYKIVMIGTQLWMAENLNYNANGSKCYNNSESNCQKYGRLYNLATAKNVCPVGWHLPSDAEWTKLTDFVDGSSAGTKLKATSGWDNNGNGMDTFGFSALPGGFGNSDGSFGLIGYYGGYWWSSTERNASNAWLRYMDYYSTYVYRDYSGKSNLYSVRCLQD